jgi:hypothetical protein
MSTGFQSASAARPATATTDYEMGGGSTGSPSPSTPTSSTPWGSTSTNAPGSGAPAPVWTSKPISADAPTGTVPTTGAAGRPPAAAQASAPPATAPPTSAPSRSARSRPRGPRRARLQLRHINPWTVLKFSCVLSIALFFVWLIVIGVLFGVLDGAGVIDKINTAYTDIQPGSEAPVRASIVFGGAAIIGVVNIVLFIALTTVGAVVYNLCADLVGGIEITLSER